MKIQEHPSLSFLPSASQPHNMADTRTAAAGALTF